MTRALVIGGVGVAAALLVSCRSNPQQIDTAPGGDAPVTAAPDDAKQVEDVLGANAGCYVCHMTFVKETLSKVHLAAKIGCTRCHGTSAAHANDEDIGATKPDIVIKRNQVNTSCRICHKTHDVRPETVVARWRERHGSKPPASQPSATITCTDCHGNHRIAAGKSTKTAG